MSTITAKDSRLEFSRPADRIPMLVCRAEILTDKLDYKK